VNAVCYTVLFIHFMFFYTVLLQAGSCFIKDTIWFAGKSLTICSGATTCCTPELESYLVNKTHWQFHGRVMNTMKKLQHVFANVSSTFDGMFLQHSMVYV